MKSSANGPQAAARRRAVERALARLERRAIAASGRRHAAVAAVLYPDGDGRLEFLLTRRSSRLRRHRGQFALPGGRLDDGESAEQAALRELHEELGLELAPEAVVGVLDDYATRSGFVITPFVLWCDRRPELDPDPDEVARVYQVGLATLDRPDVPRLTHIAQSERPVVAVPIAGHWVHAPTAAILYQLLEVVHRGNPVRVAHYEQPVFAWR